MILFFLRCILFISLFLIYSCNNDGSVIYNAEDVEMPLVTDEDGYGCSPSSICYSLDDVFYDFNSNPLYQGFYKFDKAWSEGGFHDPLSDTLGLYTFNDSYLMAVPSDFINSDDNENTVIISDNGSFIFEQLDGLEGLPSELVDLVSQPPIPRLRDSLLLVSSNAISNISNVVWNENQLRYIPNTTNSATYSKSFYLTQEYDSIIQNTLIDTGNTPIIDDIILLDYNEIVKRSVTIFDSLDSGDPIKSKRNITFKVKNTFVSPDGPYWRESTDCNDNYQRDEEEAVLLDGYVNSYGINPKSFESWCYEGACSGDGGWINAKDCCIYNPLGYGCTDGDAIDGSVSLNSDDPEQDCCENNGGSWSPTPLCQNSSGQDLSNWDMTLEGCTGNTSVAIMDLGEDWDHDNNPYSVAFCQGYEAAFTTDSICIANNGNWIPSQGTQDIEQTGQNGEPAIDDTAVSCSNGGNSLSGNYLDCDNSISNDSEIIWDFGLDWNNDSSTDDDFTDDFTEAYCLIQNQSACESDPVDLIWTDTGLGDGAVCSANDLLEQNCQSYCSDNSYDDESNCINAFEVWYDFNWVESNGTPNVPQIGSEDEPDSDDVAVGCTNGGNSNSGLYTDCDNSVPNTSETVFDYGNNWNHDGIDFIDAHCASFELGNCNFCYNSTLDSITGDDEDSCNLSNDLVWLGWQAESGTQDVEQTGQAGEPTIDDFAVSCSNGGISILGDYSDCDNSTTNWIYTPGNCETSNTWTVANTWNPNDGSCSDLTIDNETDCLTDGICFNSNFDASIYNNNEAACNTTYEWIFINAEWDEDNLTCSNSSETWDNSISFTVDSSELCLTECAKGNDIYTMNDFCWNYYDGNESYKYNGELASGYDRLSGHCYVDDSKLVPHANVDLDDEYYLAFCDTGNNLFDPPEFFNDSNGDGVYTTGANFQEAYEDRNCNELLDGEGFNLNFSDLRLNADGYIGEELFICTDSYGLSGAGSNLFCDRGNGIWDPPESYYCSPEDGINCDYSGNASTLFNRSDAPEVFLVNYDDWNLYYNSYNHYDATIDFLDNSNELRKPLLTVDPSSNFQDTGLDGCFDELEDGNGGCLCEFKTDYGNDDSLMGCEQLMYEWYSDDLPNLWKKWHQIPKDNNGNYLSATVVITEFDVGLSDISPFNYGECSNGFSGSRKDCCDYYSCNWDGDNCNWDSNDCTSSVLYCQNNIFQDCVSDLDCGGIQGSCSVSKWVENIDPNNDNYWSHNSCYYDDSCEVDNNPPEKISSKTQFDDKWNYETDDGTSTGNIILSEKTDIFSNSSGNAITSEQYYSSPGLYTDYSPHVSLADFVVTKEHLYSNLQNVGKDTLFVIDEKMKSIQVLVSDPIVDSRNTIKSRKVIDQAGLSNGTNQSSEFCEVANSFCSSTIPVYGTCLDSNSNLCEVSQDLINENTSLCVGTSNVLDCESIGCQWGNAIDDCSEVSLEASCFYEFDSNKNNICDAVENSCYNGQFETCIDELVPQLELNFYQDLLSNFYIMKTEYGFEDYDYLLFNKSSDEYVIKMTHPFYHYQSNNSIPTDIDDFVCEGCTNFWENTLLKPDTLLYSYDGNIIDGQIFISSENINTENGLYIVDKTYKVNSGVAELEYPIYNPSLYNADCNNYINEEDCCGIEDECGSLNNCIWVDPPEYDLGAFDSYCDNKSSRVISDCLIVTRVVETTTDGPGQGFRLRTKTYLKPDYKIVKETLEISWDTDPWLDEDTNWSFVSGIEYRNSTSAMQISSTPDNFLVDYETININDFENMEDFNYSPFRLNKTMGIMRYE